MPSRAAGTGSKPARSKNFVRCRRCIQRGSWASSPKRTELKPAGTWSKIDISFTNSVSPAAALSEVGRGISESLQATADTAPYKNPRPLPSQSSIHKHPALRRRIIRAAEVALHNPITNQKQWLALPINRCHGYTIMTRISSLVCENNAPTEMVLELRYDRLYPIAHGRSWPNLKCHVLEGIMKTANGCRCGPVEHVSSMYPSVCSTSWANALPSFEVSTALARRGLGTETDFPRRSESAARPQRHWQFI
jgi:hypothetical protein